MRELGVVRLIVVCDVYAQEANASGSGGYAQLATLIKRERTEHSLVCLCGDFLAGSSLADKFKGKSVVEVLNKIGVDLVVFGNHEFDYGDAVLAQRMQESDFVWLGTNVIDRETGKPFGGSAATHSVSFSFASPGGTKDVTVGFFGVCTQDTTILSYPGEKLDFQNEQESALDAVRCLEAAGVDAIVGLTHLSLKEDQALADALHAKHRGHKVQALLGGHDHLTHTELRKGSVVMKCGQDAHHVGIIDLHVYEVEKEEEIEKEKKQKGEQKGGEKTGEVGGSFVFSPSWQMLANRYVEPDEEVVRIVAGYKAQIHGAYDQAYLHQVVTRVTKGPLLTLSHEVRTRSTFIGNFLADSIRTIFRYQDPEGEAGEERQSDLSIINSGSIRGNRVYPSGSAITRLEIMEEFPMPLNLMAIDMTGAAVREVLEQHLARYPEPIGCFPNVSANVTVTVSKTRPPLNRIVALSIDGVPVKDDDRLHVATSTFLGGGGDGCTAYCSGRAVATTDTTILQVLDEYFLAHRPVIPDATVVEDRVNFVSV